MSRPSWLSAAPRHLILAVCFHFCHVHSGASPPEACASGSVGCDPDHAQLLQSHREASPTKQKLGRMSFDPDFGSIVPGHPLYLDFPGPKREIPPELETTRLPPRFDARERWPMCGKVIGHIRDQSNCGSCWAVGSVSTLNDRYCISSGDSTTILSAADPLANCNSTVGTGDMSTCKNPVGGGCFGGQLEFAWMWYVQQGAVSGGGFDDLGLSGPVETCAPYPFPPCHMPAWKNSTQCATNFQSPAQFRSCPTPGFRPPYPADKYRATSWYKLSNNTRAIQYEILQHGSVSCQVQATCSMANYTGGVYVPSGQVCGGHVMRIIGWGTEDHLPYWLVANSWGTAWGLQGFLKWIRGKDAQGIESGVVAGLFEN